MRSGADALLFPSMRDPLRHLQPTVLRRSWRKARSAAGRDDLRIHNLRHTGATLEAMTGATLAELQARLGHSTVGAALRYQHAGQGWDAEIAAKSSGFAHGQPIAKEGAEDSDQRVLRNRQRGGVVGRRNGDVTRR